jgi:hypothetical protein
VLAVQNMSARNAVDKAHEIEFKALEDSLNMMSKGMSRSIPCENAPDGDFFVFQFLTTCWTCEFAYK